MKPLKLRRWTASAFAKMQVPRLVLAIGIIATLLLGAMVWAIQEVNKTQPTSLVVNAPPGGYSRSFALWTAEFMRLRGELSATSSGKTVYPEDIRFRLESLKQREALLLKGQDATDFFDRVEGGKYFLSKVSELHRRLDPELTKPNFGRRDAQVALFEFDSLDSTISAIDQAIERRESLERGAALSSADRRFKLTAFATLCGLLLAATGIAWSAGYTWLGRKAERSKALSAAALQEALDAKSDFLSAVCHEVRSQLQMIRSPAELLLLRPRSPDDEKLLQRIQRSADALNRYLRDLLIVWGDEAGTLEIKPEPFAVADLVHALVDEFRDVCARKKLAIKATVSPEGAFVVADPIRITQILHNVVSNATKYTDSGEVAIKITHDVKHEQIRIVVSDTGPGISPELVESIFVKFQRVGTLDRTGVSSGIGLAVVQAVARQMGAAIHIESQPQVGTKFHIKIPVASPPVLNVDIKSNGGSLLVVDDQAEILALLGGLAQANGIAVDTTTSVAVAANKLATKTYAAVLMDLDMPVKSGRQLASETRRGKGLNSNTKIIAMSAADQNLVGKSWPFNGFVAKPIAGLDLVRLMQRDAA